MSEGVLFGIGFMLLIALLGALMATYDIWGAYYFRHAAEAFNRGTVDYFDSLSYAGRQFTYPPAYFEFAAQLAKAFGFLFPNFAAARVPLLLLGAFAYAASSYWMFHRFPRGARVVAAGILVTLWGTLMGATGIGLHIFAFTLVNCAVILGEGSALFAAASLGIAFAAHPLSLIAYPLAALSARAFRVDAGFVVRGALACMGAIALALPFYLPIFTRAGLPYEIVPQTWGYLLTYGFDGIRFSLQFLYPLAIAVVAAGALKRQWLAAGTVGALIVMNALVSLRFDVLVAAALAGALPVIFIEEFRKPWFAALVILAFIVPNVLVGAVVMNGTSYYCSWGLVNDACVKPMEYAGEFAPAGSLVALNPIYGHLEAYVAGKPVLADLYVEYADEKKYSAENAFYHTGNETGLLGYGVDVAVVDWTFRNLNASGDRVYDNGFMQVYRRSG